MQRTPGKLSRLGELATAVAASLAMLAMGGVARAHHVVADFGTTQAVPRTVAGTEAAAGGFALNGRSGRWQVVAPSLEVSFWDRVSLFGRLAVAHIEVDGGKGPSATGVGDGELAVKVAVLATADRRATLSAGLGWELPTGNADNGIGAGHHEAVPFVTGSYAFAFAHHHGDEHGEEGHHEAQEAAHGAGLVLFGLIADRLSLGGRTRAGVTVPIVHGSLLGPHTDHEAFARAMVSFVHAQHYVGAGVDAVRQWSDPGWGPLVARAQAGVMFGEGYCLYAGFEHTVAGTARFGSAGRLGLARMF